jgi:hypothetical protein
VGGRIIVQGSRTEKAEKTGFYRGVSQITFFFSKKSKNGVKGVKGVIYVIFMMFFVDTSLTVSFRGVKETKFLRNVRPFPCF